MDCRLGQVDSLFFFFLTAEPCFHQVTELPGLLMPSKLPKYFSRISRTPRNRMGGGGDDRSHVGKMFNQGT